MSSIFQLTWQRTFEYDNDWYMRCLSAEESLWLEYENVQSPMYTDENSNVNFHWLKLGYSPLSVWSYFNNHCTQKEETLMEKYYEVHVRFPLEKREAFYPLLLDLLFKPGFRRDCWTHLTLSNHIELDEDDVDRLPMVTFYVFGKMRAEYLLQEMHFFLHDKFDLKNDLAKLKPMIFEDYPFGIENAISCAGGSRDEKLSILNFLFCTSKRGKLQKEYKVILDKILHDKMECKCTFKNFQKFLASDGKYFVFQPPIKISKDANVRYKTSLCNNWKLEGRCRYGKYCLFAHGASELTKLPCIYWDKGECANGEHCNFSHNNKMRLSWGK